MNQTSDVICLSHLRWGFVYQRPNHLLSRAARERRVFFVEEPVHHEGPPRLEITPIEDGLFVVVPTMRLDVDPPALLASQQELLDGMVHDHAIRSPLLWVYTPMAMPLAARLDASFVVYDCMDELSHFKGAPAAIRELERTLFQEADLVFTGGHSLYEAKKSQHHAVHPFPSSVDAGHFAAARRRQEDPRDQAPIAHPRAGFFGVIDERMDLELLERVARERPDVQLVMIGPVVKIDAATLPRLPNIHWLGSKTYAELPAYLAGWDVAIMPFALNDSTRYISPTKTLEYMAAGKPVVSTAIHDVVVPYGECGVVRIADARTFARAIDDALAEVGTPSGTLRQRHADEMVAATSWDRTWRAMASLIGSSKPLQTDTLPTNRSASCSIS